MRDYRDYAGGDHDRDSIIRLIKGVTPRKVCYDIGGDDEGGSGLFGIADDLAMMFRDEFADTVFATDRALGTIVIKDVVAILADEDDFVAGNFAVGGQKGVSQPTEDKLNSKKRAKKNAGSDDGKEVADFMRRKLKVAEFEDVDGVHGYMIALFSLLWVETYAMCFYIDIGMD